MTINLKILIVQMQKRRLAAFNFRSAVLSSYPKGWSIYHNHPNP
ncbi:hypothetical protein [Nostoc sp.]